MKIRNWKLCTLAIFLAVCFTLCAGNCYSQIGDTWDLDYKLGPGHPVPGPIFDPFPGPIYDPGPWYPYRDPFEFTWGLPVWTPPAGRTALDLFKDLMPNLTYERFYKTDYSFNIDDLYDDSYGLPGPTMDNWNLYQRTDLYSRPKRGEHNLYQFTKDLLVQPRQPDVYTSYGAYGGYAGMGGYGMGGYGGMGGMGGPGVGFGTSAGFSPPFGLGNAFSGAF